MLEKYAFWGSKSMNEHRKLVNKIYLHIQTAFDIKYWDANLPLFKLEKTF